MVFTSTRTMSWSLRPGRIDTLSIRVVFVVKKRSKMCLPPCGRGYCLLEEAVIEDLHTLSVECGKFAVRGGC